MITFIRLSPEMFDTIANDNGFIDGKELMELISRLDSSEPWKRLAFNGWKEKDGSKAGLLRLTRIMEPSDND